MSAHLDPTNQMVFDHAIDFRTGNMRLGARYSRARPAAARTPAADVNVVLEGVADQSAMASAIPGYNRLK